MSSLADAPDDEPTRVTSTAAHGARVHGVGARASGWVAAHPDPFATVVLAALLLAVGFLAGGGGSLERTTIVSIAMTLIGGTTVAVAIVADPPNRRLWGGVTLLLFTALTALTLLSILWAFNPSDAWNAGNLTLGYLGAFAGAIALVRLAADRWAAVLYAIVLAAVVLAGYALLVKVFPSTYEPAARLRAPFDYWNAVGLIAVMGIPGCLWLGARRDGHAAPRALAVPALWLLLTALLLSVGRGPLIAALIACAFWFAVVPLRLRGAAVLGLAGAGALLVSFWAFGNDALSSDGVPLDVRTDAGDTLGLLLAPTFVVLLIAGLFLSFALSRAALTAQRRTAIGAVLLVLLALVPLAGAARLAVSDRGLPGSISDGWTRLTDPNAQQPNNEPGRLGSVGSVRARYWDDALTIWKLDPPRTRWLGVGAEGYSTARRALQTDRLRVAHAHGYAAQTLADLGLAGIGVNALLLVAWLVAAARTTALLPRRRYSAWLVAAVRARDATVPFERREPVPWTAERIGLVTLATMVLAFGIHSTIDWTWFVPGTAVVALLCAGWVAGRGPCSEAPGHPAPRGGWRAPWRAAPVRLALAATVLVAALAASWVIWQPQRSASAETAAQEAQDAGRLAQARTEAQHAVDVNPLAVSPRITLSGIEAEAGEPDRALATLVSTVQLQPANYEPWLALGQLQLDQGATADALASLSAAVFLNPWGPAAQVALAQARAQAGQPPAAPTP